MKIVPATMAHIANIHRLTLQLGYDRSLDEVQVNLKRILQDSSHEVVVIQDQQSRVLGWMNLAIRHRIEDISFLQIAAVVTDQDHRGQGLGKSLLAHAEARAKDMQLGLIRLHSSAHRLHAHQFYESQGFARIGDSTFFQKVVG